MAHEPIFDQIDRAFETLIAAVNLPDDIERRIKEIREELRVMRGNIKH